MIVMASWNLLSAEGLCISILTSYCSYNNVSVVGNSVFHRLPMRLLGLVPIPSAGVFFQLSNAWNSDVPSSRHFGKRRSTVDCNFQLCHYSWDKQAMTLHVWTATTQQTVQIRQSYIVEHLVLHNDWTYVSRTWCFVLEWFYFNKTWVVLNNHQQCSSWQFTQISRNTLH